MVFSKLFPSSLGSARPRWLALFNPNHFGLNFLSLLLYRGRQYIYQNSGLLPCRELKRWAISRQASKSRRSQAHATLDLVSTQAWRFSSQIWTPKTRIEKPNWIWGASRNFNSPHNIVTIICHYFLHINAVKQNIGIISRNSQGYDRLASHQLVTLRHPTNLWCTALRMKQGESRSLLISQPHKHLNHLW